MALLVFGIRGEQYFLHSNFDTFCLMSDWSDGNITIFLSKCGFRMERSAGTCLLCSKTNVFLWETKSSINAWYYNKSSCYSSTCNVFISVQQSVWKYGTDSSLIGILCKTLLLSNLSKTSCWWWWWGLISYHFLLK